ncbi:MAG: chromosome segregation protein SMC [Actinobacteria bacterium]|nr:chromosome segregation protein SMC [Actinomycetota bacterium]
MYVKSLTLKGFKSFASSTQLRLEPGITCIVGPNGSGKSNVVDALAWVMGEQGAKSLRGGKMEDVIFAGTADRPPLGRAEVTMTIDNTDGALPIDYTEVTISRTMFRGGGSEYALNGTPCRLVDVQELLSDSGIGREMHVIVGQGQLDTVLRATPEDRRGFIEEAAGVLKHRKRKERALRKLDAMEANLVRVKDLVGEIRRQLGPLGRQAETARRAALIQADARDARLRLLADELVQLTSTLEQEVADETALLARRDEVESSLAMARHRLSDAETALAQAAPDLDRAQRRWFELTAMTDRLTAVGTLAAERVRLLSAEPAAPDRPQRDPQTLRAQAQQARDQDRQLAEEIAALEADLARVVAGRVAVENAYAAERDRLARVERAAADRREGLARLAGQVAAKRSRIEAAEGEIARLREVVERAEQRAADAEAQFARLESSVAVDEEGEEGLDEAHARAEDALAAARARAEELREAERAAERDRGTAQGRAEALALSLRRQDGGRVLLGDVDDQGVPTGSGAQPGLIGVVAQAITVQGGHETAVAAALGWAADALAVESLDAATAALARLRAQDAGRAALLVPETAPSVAPDPDEPPAAGSRWARSVVECPPALRASLDALLARVALVPDEASARDVVRRVPGATAVTANGDVYSPGWVRGGSAAAPSLLEVQAAHEEATAAASEAGLRRDRARFALAAVEEEIARSADEVEAALADLHASDARMNAIAEQLGTLGSQLRAARAEADRAQASIVAAEAALTGDAAALRELADRLAAAEAEPADPAQSAPAERDRLEAEAVAARASETELRLTLRGRQERARGVQGRAEALEHQARAEIAARERAEANRRAREQQSASAARVRTAADRAVAHLRDVCGRADAARVAATEHRAEIEASLTAVRREVDAHAEELRQLVDSVHRDEVVRTQQQLRIEALQARAVEELGIDPEVLIEEFGPHRPVPVLPEPGAEPPLDAEGAPLTTPYVREQQEKRLRRAERGLAQLGRINPLALEEYAALEERHAFLTEQLEDLKRSKRDLLDIVREVDERVERVFAEAFADTAREFEGVFARLFPGGAGRLLLTDPDDLLTTGIEVEARPPGKKIKRLSLLSGGERSLTAVALLVAIFKARPSPFYIMDEVEAALDDTNLGRLIGLFEELRDSSQLIVITHQKRTMEVADALYGVTMRGDGVTTVVSQRLRDVAPAGVGAGVPR